MRIIPAGDSALLVSLEPVIDPAVNERAIAIASVVARSSVAGVRDVVPTFHSVAVHFDPLRTDLAALERMLAAMEPHNEAPHSGTAIEVPVVYGGAAGPDLDEVAAFGRCSSREVISRHAWRPYRVYMLGFLPGFPYLAPVDDGIAVPRRATPRSRVPAGSVGIAGRQTGIYPRDSPGGWQIIGRTPVQIFNPANARPAMLSPGDTVRFVPSQPAEEGRDQARRGPGSAEEPPASRVGVTRSGRFITVVRPGLSTTVQDHGRWGHQALGVSVSGAMDLPAHRLANALVGNAPDAATLEATLAGPELRFDAHTRIAVAGADLQASVSGTPVLPGQVHECTAGSVLRFGERRAGARAYVACDGGIAVPPVLGSCATHLRSGLGGLEGRALHAGDRLPLGAGSHVRRSTPRPMARSAGEWHRDIMGRSPGVARLRVLPGPQADCFDRRALDALLCSRYTISPQSDRMGYRLEGGTVIQRTLGEEMISDAAFAGAVQIPPSGRPILLMADRQTTGGYPQLVVVITADIPLAAQQAPGDSLEFVLCSRSEAIAALVAAESRFLALE